MRHTDAVILGYHQIGSSAGRAIYCVDPAAFRNQLEWLREHSIQVISLRSLVGAISLKDMPLSGKVALTFDDCSTDQFEVALPILKEFGYSACFFAAADCIGKSGFMDWGQLRILKQEGMEIGSHGLTHRLLDIMPRDSLKKELYVSKKTLEEKLASPVDYFSVPRGYFNQTAQVLAREAGYTAILTSISGYIGTHSRSSALNRFIMRGDYVISRFRGIIERDAGTVIRIRFREMTVACVRRLFGRRLFEAIRQGIFRDEYRPTERLFPGR